MARYERDPKARRDLAILLAVAEVLAVAGVFFLIFSAYVHWVMLKFSWGAHSGIVAAVASALFLILAVVQGIQYVKGRSWARAVFVVENLLLLAGGVLWFVKVTISTTSDDSLVPLMGAAVPLVTLFPLLWPLLSFRPIPPAARM